MIEIGTKIHDRFTVEFKVGFVTEQTSRMDDFLLGMWIFVPSRLDVNPSTYTKKAFYRYFKSNIRLITPRLPLSEIVSGSSVPLNNVRNAKDDYDYQLRMFVSIVKSALRSSLTDIEAASPGPERRELCIGFVADVRSILNEYLTLGREEDREGPHRRCGEFLCNISAEAVFRAMKSVECREELVSLLDEISVIRKKYGFLSVMPGNPEANRNYIYRHGMLKKYSEEQLYLAASKTKDGVIAEQAYYSVAAGLAMLFATVVAWAFQRQFGNLTWPLFIALIISYMMKDRIKELMRYYFSHRVGSRYFDNKAEIRHRDRTLGFMKEGMDFVKRSKVPYEVLSVRGNSSDDENVMLYREMLRIDRVALEKISVYRHEGINDIIRLQVQGFLRKADNPVKNVGYLDEEGNVMQIPCEKDYYLHIVLQYKQDGEECFKCFRLRMNRDGIKSVAEI